MQKYFLITLISLIGYTCYPQQTKLKLNSQKSYIGLDGSSTFGNWKSEAKFFNGSLNYIDSFKVTSQKKGFAIIKIDVKSIASRNKLRDKATHKALKSKDFPFIIFTSNSGTFYKKISDKKNQLIVTGILTIAGVNKTIKTMTNVTELSYNELEFKGHYKLKMTDFGIKPPSVFFGLIKVKDEININYSLVFSN